MGRRRVEGPFRSVWAALNKLREGSPAQIARAAGLKGKRPNVRVSMILRELHRQGLVRHSRWGRYRAMGGDGHRGGGDLVFEPAHRGKGGRIGTDSSTGMSDAEWARWVRDREAGAFNDRGDNGGSTSDPRCGCCGQRVRARQAGPVVWACGCQDRGRCGMCGRCVDHCRCGSGGTVVDGPTRAGHTIRRNGDGEA